MTSQSDIANTSFIEDCINKKRSIQDIHEALGLYSETVNKRKEPAFPQDGANDLHKRITEIAKDYKKSHRIEKQQRLIDLAKEETFSNEVQELADQYGPLLWGRTRSSPSRYRPQQAQSQGEYGWDRDADRDMIRFYIRCWIVRHAAQEGWPIPRIGKGRIQAKSLELSENEFSSGESSITPPIAGASHPANLPMRPPEAATNNTPGEPRADMTTAPDTATPRQDFDAGGEPHVHSSVTPSKRKATSFDSAPATGKQRKANKGARVTASPSFENHHGAFSGRTPPISVLFEAPLAKVIRPEHRESTPGSDRTRGPPHRSGTLDRETVIDSNEIMTEGEDVRGASDGEHINQNQSSIACTEYDIQRQDSVIPHTPQVGEAPQQIPDQEGLGTNQNHTNSLVHKQSVSSTDVDVSKLNGWQEKRLRIELFKLVLSYVNGINQFSPEAFQPDAEEKMNNLLYQFWINDTHAIQTKFGNNFSQLQATLETWMSMRHLLTEFRKVTGYFGKPGDDWKDHWKRWDVAARANASIAFVEMRSFSTEGNTSDILGPTSNDELAMMFEFLTRIDGSNGVAEFEGIRSYNEVLMKWFS